MMRIFILCVFILCLSAAPALADAQKKSSLLTPRNIELLERYLLSGEAEDFAPIGKIYGPLLEAVAQMDDPMSGHISAQTTYNKLVQSCIKDMTQKYCDTLQRGRGKKKLTLLTPKNLNHMKRYLAEGEPPDETMPMEYPGDEIERNFIIQDILPDLLKEMAETGNIAAQERYGAMLHSCVGMEPCDKKEGRRWLKRAEDGKPGKKNLLTPENIANLEKLRTTDDVAAYDAIQPIYGPLLEALSKKGDAKAQSEYGIFMIRCPNKEDILYCDEEEGREWLLKAAGKGAPDAPYWLGYYYMRDVESVPKDYTQAIKWLKIANEKLPQPSPGHPPAVFLLGEAYMDGKADYAEAAAWFRKSLAMNDGFSSRDSACRLGLIYMRGGHGVERDADEASAFWEMPKDFDALRKKADDNDVAAQLALGEGYRKSKCRSDIKKYDGGLEAAMERWELNVAAHGNIEAQFRLGSKYLFTKGKERQGVSLLIDAAAGGSREARCRLAILQIPPRACAFQGAEKPYPFTADELGRIESLPSADKSCWDLVCD